MDRFEVFAQYFDTIEDGARINVFIDTNMIRKMDDATDINRIVRGVSIVKTTVEFKQGKYEITYPQAIVFHFDDCNLIIEIIWVFGYEGFILHFEPIDAPNFGVYDDGTGWIDPEDEIPIFTQTIEPL